MSPIFNYLHFELNECDQELLRQTSGYEEADCASETELRQFFAGHMLIGYAANTFINKTMFEDNPMATLNDIVFQEQLQPDKHMRKELLLNYNEV